MTVSSTLEPVVVSGDPGLLERLAGNLIENAIRHNVTGGTVAVSVTSRERRPTPCSKWRTPVPCSTPSRSTGSSSRSGGPGQTGLRTTAGVGLGLSIVDAVVTAHHGTMTLRARPEGGLLVRVQLPVAEVSRQPRYTGCDLFLACDPKEPQPRSFEYRRNAKGEGAPDAARPRSQYRAVRHERYRLSTSAQPRRPARVVSSGSSSRLHAPKLRA